MENLDEKIAMEEELARRIKILDLVSKTKIRNYKLEQRIDKAINKLEYYNSGEALLYVPIQEIIDILKGDE